MDVHTKEQRSKNMQAIRNRGTAAEVALAKALWSKGHRYRKNNKAVYGKPDLTFRALKIAVFVDGEFFHGKDWDKQKFRIQTNREFWWKKIESNMRRDDIVINRLKEDGWIVLRFWDKEIFKNVSNCVSRIENAVNFKKNESQVLRDTNKIKSCS
jgi:DNA mismatch endonuclease (patch repair protein)